MANPITTTGTTTPISTTHQSGESISAWVKRHDDAVEASTVSGNTLTTTWTSSGATKTVITTRQRDETDSDFKDRHVFAYLLQMIEEPPVP